MRLDNETAYDGREVRKILRWVLRELDAEELVHRVALRYQMRGRSGYSGHAGTRECRLFLRLPRPDRYPMEPHARGLRGGPPPVQPETWQEALVAITAHEAQHMLQEARWRKSRRRPRYSEVECEWTEYRLWQRWAGRENIQLRAAKPAAREE